MDDAGVREYQRVVLSVSDPSQLRSLAQWLQATKGVRVDRTAGTPGDGELGALEVLAVVASSSVLVAAIKVLPEFLRAKRSGISITMTLKDQPFTVDATNVDEVMPILERLLDE